MTNEFDDFQIVVLINRLKFNTKKNVPACIICNKITVVLKVPEYFVFSYIFLFQIFFTFLQIFSNLPPAGNRKQVFILTKRAFL